MDPIQKTSMDIRIKPGEELPEIFKRIQKTHKYEIVWMDNKNTYTFFCSHYEVDMTGEWIFYDVVMDTSKRDSKGNLTLIRLTYHPQTSLVNIPFMVLPAEGENSKEQIHIHIPENVNELPSDPVDEHEPGTPCPYNDKVDKCNSSSCFNCRER